MAKSKSLIAKLIVGFVCVLMIIIGAINLAPMQVFADTAKEINITRYNSLGEEDCNGEYIYFGSYPQSKETEKETKPDNISELNKKVGCTDGVFTVNSNWKSYGYYNDGTQSDFMYYTDTSLKKADGSIYAYYRGVYFNQYRPDFTSKTVANTPYQQDSGYTSGTIYWFKYEPLKWRILSEKDGTAYLLCETLIDSQEYQSLYTKSGSDYDVWTDYYVAGTSNYANSFEHSTIRSWLNSNFYQVAFNDDEKAIIQRTTVKNDVSTLGQPTYSDSADTFAGNDTYDYVFLPSYQDVLNAEYGFSSKTDFTNTYASRQKSFSQYAQSQGAMGTGVSEETKLGGWWLRSPSADFGCYANVIDLEGRVMDADVENTSYGVCPAICISITNSTHTYSGDCDEYCNDCNSKRVVIDEVDFERVNQDNQPVVDGEYIKFGLYPQSKVTNTDYIADLNKKVGYVDGVFTANSNWKSYGYYNAGAQSDFMYYTDTYLTRGDGSVYAYYRGVYFSDYRQNSTKSSPVADENLNQYKNGYLENTIYWFQYEPIKWKILSESNGVALVVADMIIDSQDFNYTWNNKAVGSENYYSNNYAESSIREWLNTSFYQTAFSSLQTSLIKNYIIYNDLTTVKTTTAGENQYVCANIADKIFFLSYQDAISVNYGFDATDSTRDNARKKLNTDYALCQGAYNYKGVGDWWLRSPAAEGTQPENKAYLVDANGACSTTLTVTNTFCGVAPAMYVEIPASEHTGTADKLVSNNDGSHSYVYTCCDTVVRTENCSIQYDKDCTTADGCICGYTIQGNSNHTLEIKADKDSNNHVMECSVVGCDHEEDKAHVYDQEKVAEEYKSTDATCTASAKYYKSCLCGHKGTETFSSGNVNQNEHTGTANKFVNKNNGTHDIVYSCCDALVKNEQCVAVSPDKDCTTADNCSCGYAIQGNANHTLEIKADKDSNNHVMECTVVGCDHEEDKAHVYDQEKVADEYKATDATCISSATYYKSCLCGHKGTETFSSGSVNQKEHTGTPTKLITQNNGIHSLVYSCCDKLVENQICSSVEKYDDCSKQEVCSCGYVTKTIKEHDFLSGNEYKIENDGHSIKCDDCAVYNTKQSHSGGESNCQTQKKCEYCLTSYGGFGNHNYSDTYLFINADESKHYHVCLICSQKDDGQDHTPNIPTATEESAKYCTACQYVMEAQLGHTHVYNEVVADNFKISNATCKTQAKYLKSCVCGQLSTESFYNGSIDVDAHMGTADKLVNKYNGTHDIVYSCCDALVKNEQCVAVSPDKDCTTAEHCLCGYVFEGNANHTLEIKADKDSNNHVMECTVVGCDHEEVKAHVYDQEKVADEYKSTDATCISSATYYKSCLCGHKGMETFSSGSVNQTAHTGTADKLVSNNDGSHSYLYTCCDTVVSSENCSIQYDKDCTTADSCACGYTVNGNTSHTLSIKEDKDSNNHVMECTVVGCDHEEDKAHVYDQEVVADEYKSTDATCISSATYYKSCLCGHKGTETFLSGSVNQTAHTGTSTKLISQNNGIHSLVYSCCDKLVENQICSSEEKYDDCSKQEVCSCGYVTKTIKEHDFLSGNIYKIENDGHSKKCDDCGVYNIKQSHSGGESNCQAQKKCEYCLTSYGGFGNHNYSDTYLAINSDESKHYHVCLICSQKDDGQAHTPNIPSATEESAKICSTCQYVMEVQLGHTHVYNEVVADNFKISNATCKTQAKYLKSCVCGQLSTESFYNGSIDVDAHTGTADKLVNKNNGTHDIIYSCCDALVKNEKCVAVLPDKDCTTDEHCLCGYVFEGNVNHSMSIVLDKNGTYHTISCTIEGCEYLQDVEHTFNQEVVEEKYKNTDATCVMATTYFKSCLCGHKGIETFDNGNLNANNHASNQFVYETNNNGTHVKKYSCCLVSVTSGEVCSGGQATCTEKAVCELCQTAYGELLSHIGGTATCTEKAICSECNQPYGETLPHTFTVQQQDQTHHWNKCENCDETDTKQLHVYGNDNVCDDCQFEKIEEPTINVTVENGKTEGGETSVVVNENDTITVIANSAPEGKYFKGWAVNGIIVSTESSYTFAPTEDINLVAVYDDVADDGLSIGVIIGIAGGIAIVVAIIVVVVVVKKKKKS